MFYIFFLHFRLKPLRMGLQNQTKNEENVYNEIWPNIIEIIFNYLEIVSLSTTGTAD
jgi:hypothetical protein